MSVLNVQSVCPSKQVKDNDLLGNIYHMLRWAQQCDDGLIGKTLSFTSKTNMWEHDEKSMAPEAQDQLSDIYGLFETFEWSHMLLYGFVWVF